VALISAADHGITKELSVSAFKFDINALLTAAFDALISHIEGVARNDGLLFSRSYGELVARASTG
jgi:hypothetical protein